MDGWRVAAAAVGSGGEWRWLKGLVRICEKKKASGGVEGSGEAGQAGRNIRA